MTVVLGYDFWFPQPEAEAARKVDLVALFPPGTAPPCRAPERDPPADAAGGAEPR